MDDDSKNREKLDDQMINEAFERLKNDYLNSCHRKKIEIITKAFNFARQAHRGVRRLSGEPYIMHPIAVAQIVCSEIGLGSTSICSALLHDVVEDTDYTVEDISNMFGPKIAQIVDGLTKISGGIFGEQASAQAENFRKLLLTMSEDIRVILIKMADRLHNMRTLESQPANKQYKIAGETLYLYAPLAYRLGLYKIKSELENLSFRFEHPDEYADIVGQLEKTKQDRRDAFVEFVKPIEAALTQMGCKYNILERIKTPYSIWTKMNNKGLEFDQIYDILAVRIVFDPINPAEEDDECFRIYTALSKIYRRHPDRLRDWITKPKANGYQALHVTMMSKQGYWIEVQIRSRRMDDIAEQGLAAHWKYKEEQEKAGNAEHGEDVEKNDDPNSAEDSELNEWLRTIREILDDPQPDAIDFLDTIKLNLYASEIFVFTPKGDIKTMPADCTVLDFAYSIHTTIGSHCIGAKVNHKLMPVSYHLKSGDQVEILTSKAQQVKPEWVAFARTAKAKAKVEAAIRRDNREVQKHGEELFEAWLEKNGFTSVQAATDQLIHFHNAERRDLFFQAIGENQIVLGQADIDELQGKNKKKGSEGSGGWRKYVPFVKLKKAESTPQKGTAETSADATASQDNSQGSAVVGDRQKDVATSGNLFVVPEKFNRKMPVILTDQNISQYIFPDCCHPIPGDDALGFIDNQNHIQIHKRDCPVANKLKASYGNRILDVKWDMKGTMFFDATIRLAGIDRRGLVNEVTQIISRQLSVDIRKLMFTTDNGIFDGTIDLRVKGRDDLQGIIKSLRNVVDLKEISRVV